MSERNYEALRYTLDPRGVATVVLDRPEKHNALNHQLICELTDVFERIGRNPRVRVVVLTGEGGSFSAGGDLKWFAANLEMSRQERQAEGALLANMLHEINYLPKPVIGRINGPAYGGGIGMLAVCDVSVGGRRRPVRAHGSAARTHSRNDFTPCGAADGCSQRPADVSQRCPVFSR